MDPFWMVPFVLFYLLIFFLFSPPFSSPSSSFLFSIAAKVKYDIQREVETFFAFCGNGKQIENAVTQRVFFLV